MNSETPNVGDKIYVDNNWYLYHGRDDFNGGVATISEVWFEETKTYIAIDERPGWLYNWGFLKDKQDSLASRFGESLAHLDPDLDPESNTGFNQEVTPRGNKVLRFYNEISIQDYKDRLTPDNGWDKLNFIHSMFNFGVWSNRDDKAIIIFNDCEEVNISCSSETSFDGELLAIEAEFGD